MNSIEDYRNHLLEPSKYPGELVPIDPSGLELPKLHPVTLALEHNKRHNLTPKYYGGDEFLLNKPLLHPDTGKPVKKFWEKLFYGQS